VPLWKCSASAWIKTCKRTTADHKGDWRPIAFLMTDGGPSDTALYAADDPEVQKRPFASVIACAAGASAKVEPLQKLTSAMSST
jgi:uncharacterized protein YegL